jgi:electron transfer flavoprotein beta subunit
MNIVVCVKQILDPNLPPAKFKVDSKARQIIPPEGIPLVMNPYDAQAVEMAVRLKEKNGGKITAVSLGGPEAVSAVKYALSLGADEGVALSDEAFFGSDSLAVAHILGRAIRKIGAYDLVLCGRQAADWDEGLTGPLLAEELGIPVVNLVRDIENVGGDWRFTRVISGGEQVFAVFLPALATITNEAPQTRLPTGWGIISANRKQIPVWNGGDIDVDPTRIGSAAAVRKLTALTAPERKRNCEMISKETVAEAAETLARRLGETGAFL